MSEEDYGRLNEKAKISEESLVRNVYLADSTVLEKQFADSLMQVIVARNLANPHLSELSYSRTLVMQVKMGQITAKEAMERLSGDTVMVLRRKSVLPVMTTVSFRPPCCLS